MNFSVSLLTIGLLELVFHIDGNYLFLRSNDSLRWLRLAVSVLTVSIMSAWYVNFIGNDRANIFDNRRTMVVEIDIHIVVQLP